MADMYSDDDEFEDTARDVEPMVVELVGRGSRRSPVTARRSPTARASSRHSQRQPEYSDDYSEDDDDDDVDEESEELPTSRSGTRPPRSSRNVKTVNGKKGINMTPPDKLLEKATKTAKRLSAAKKADQAIETRIKIVALTRIVYGSNHWRLADAHVRLAQDYLDLKGYYAQTEYHTENAMSIMLSSVSTTSSEQEKADVFGVLFRLNYLQGTAQVALKKYTNAEAALQKGTAQVALKKYTNAEAALQKADRAYQACSKLSCVTDDECDEMEIMLTQATARLSWRQKKYAVAGSQFDKVIDLTRRRFGDDAVELIALYQESGRLEQSKGRLANHDKAIEMFLQAHSIATANYKYASEELVDTALALAQAYSNTGREEAESSAESYLNECLSTCTTVYGPNHRKTVEVQDELAKLLIRTEKEQEALDILRSSIPMKCEVYGDYSESVSDTYKLIASVHLAQGNIEKALRCYKKCHNIEVLVLGKNSKKAKDSESTIDILLANPALSKKFVLNKDDELKKRPRFNAFSAKK